MTVQEALRKTQGRDAGAVNRSAVRCAEALLQPGETVSAAVIANISTKRGHFPGVVVLTDRRVLAACGLPGIKRTLSLPLEALETCKETNSFLNYKAVFLTKNDGFTMTIDPEAGERFSRCIAVLNGEEAEFDSVNEVGRSGILNPLLMRNMLRKRRTVEKEKARRKAAQEAVNARFTAEIDTENAAVQGPAEDVETAARRLNQQLSQAREQGAVADTDPLAVAARLAESLAKEEKDGVS